MKTMRAAVADIFTKQLTLEDVPVPEPGPDDVLVRVKACGICLSDVHVIEGLLPAPIPQVIPGHEAAGVIERVGAYVPAAWQPGQRVLMMGGKPCGTCRNCVRGIPMSAAWPRWPWAPATTVPGRSTSPCPGRPWSRCPTRS